MLIVKYGSGAFHRVGVVVGEYTDMDLGQMLCVRTPYNIIAGQRFDPVAKGKALPATMAELLDYARVAQEEANARLMDWVKELPDG